MYYMLFDNPSDKKNMTFLNNYETAKIKQVYPLSKCNSIKSMIIACKNCIKQTDDKDTIICWYDFMAIICWWICKIKLKRRNIIAINILLKDKKTIKNKLAKALYKQVLSSNNVQATVTSIRYGEYVNEILGIKKRYILLHDIYHGIYCINYKGSVNSKTVFCGGRNGRNWKLLIKLAQAMPDVTFNCVMTRDNVEKYKEKFTNNIVVKYDVSEIEFLEFMCQSQLVVMPLDTEAPAGLIAFYQAAANKKMTITSNTVTMQEYFSKGRGALCENNIDDWKNKIIYYLQHKNEADACAEKLKKYLEDECSEQKYANILGGMLIE